MSNMPIVITGGTIITSTSEIHDRALVIRDGKIDALLPNCAAVTESHTRIDAYGCRIL